MTGRYKVIEAKFMDGSSNLSVSRISSEVGPVKQVQLSGDWLFNQGNPSNTAITRSVDQGSMTQAQADTLIAAFAAKNVDRKIIVVANDVQKDISRGLGDVLGPGTTPTSA